MRRFVKVRWGPEDQVNSRESHYHAVMFDVTVKYLLNISFSQHFYLLIQVGSVLGLET